jgi:hypothetical protein
MTFHEYLRLAVERARNDEAHGADDRQLQWINCHCRRGVRANADRITSASFLEDYLWCVGSTQKDYTVRARHWNGQVALFRDCDAHQIVADACAIQAEWAASKRYLSPKSVTAMLDVATRIKDMGWEPFRAEYLFLPADPEAETPAAWSATYWALRELKGVGHAISWYLIRNLFGGPFFKPDVHIEVIAWHFFGDEEDPVEAMASAVRQVWPRVCSDRRLLPAHLGEVDYILWWHRRNTGLPEAGASVAAGCA